MHFGNCACSVQCVRMWEGLVTGSSFNMDNTYPWFHYTVPDAEAILKDGYWSLFVSDLPFHGLDPVLGGKGKPWRRSQGDHLDRIHRRGILCRESSRTWTSLHQYDWQSLSITTLEGQPLLTAGRSVGSMRLVSVGKDKFIQQKDGEGSTDYAVPASVGGIMDIVPGTLEALVRRLQSVDGSVHSKKLQASTEELLTRSEVQLIERAAFALGGKGVTGLKYPSILPFYLATLQLQRLLTNSTSVGYPPSHLYSKHVSKRASCFETCPPCPNDNCLGMCGLACNCWRFLCGDCCYHLGCYDHDLCCRERFVQTACLFPFGFSCESHYQCWIVCVNVDCTMILFPRLYYVSWRL